MVNLDLLRVSLTKNGYFKVAELLKEHSRTEVLDHLWGSYPGINITKSQIANMLDCNPVTGQIPDYWDAIRTHGHLAIDAFALVAMLFSHHRLIRLMQIASQRRPEFTGYFLRDDLTTKEYTNFAYTLGCFGLSEYRRGAGAVEYNLAPVIYHLRSAGGLVQDLLRHKLQRAEWRNPDQYESMPDRPLSAEMRRQQFNRVVSMTWPRFSKWLDGRLTMTEPNGRFGLREVGLFATPIQPA